MIPIRDINPRRSFPIINYLIIAFTVCVFFLQLASSDFEGFVYSYSFIPNQFDYLDPSSYFYVFSSIFLHGGILHILSNMWFLHIFGDNVEDRMGHLPYLFFYLIFGAAAVFAQYIISPSSDIPMIGASGAIAGVTGAYFVLFRQSKILTLVPLFIIWDLIELPAWFFLGYWFVLQILSGFGSLGSLETQQGGVAFFAHIGGFAVGYIIAKFFYRSREIVTAT